MGTYSSLGVNKSTPGVGASNKRTARERLSSELKIKGEKAMRKIILLIMIVALTSCTSLTKSNYIIGTNDEITRTSPLTSMWNSLVGGVNYVLDGDSPTTRVARYKNKQIKKQMKEKAKLEASLSN